MKGIVNIWQNRRLGGFVLGVSVVVCLISSSLVFGQTDPPPGPDATGMLKEATGWFTDLMGVVLGAIALLSFAVAAWAGISVVSALITRKSEVGGVFLIFAVAVFMTIFVGQMAVQGDKKLTEITSGG